MTKGLAERRALVSALGKGAQVGAALDAFREMQRLQLTVPPAVYHELIGACGAAGDGDGAEEVFAALQAHKGASKANSASPLPSTRVFFGCERPPGKAPQLVTSSVSVSRFAFSVSVLTYCVCACLDNMKGAGVAGRRAERAK